MCNQGTTRTQGSARIVSFKNATRVPFKANSSNIEPRHIFHKTFISKINLILNLGKKYIFKLDKQNLDEDSKVESHQNGTTKRFHSF